MTATTHHYLALWPILDDTRTASALIAEASASLDPMATRDGARIVGPPSWIVAGDRLVCMAPARPLPPPEPEPDPAAERERRDAEVLRLAGLRWSSGQIGAALGITPVTVRRILARHGQRTAYAPGGRPRDEGEDR